MKTTLDAPIVGSNGYGALDEPPGLTDLGNAQRLVHDHGDALHYVHQWHQWLVYDGARYRKDETGEIDRRAKATVKAMYAEAAYTDDKDARKGLIRHATQSEAEPKIRAMISLARSEVGIPVVPDQLDADRFALNVLNGTLDLKTGTLRPHRREDLITKLAPVAFDPAAEAPLWTATLARIFGGNARLLAFLQRAFGYALTGATIEQVMFIFHGAGANGKSTVLGAFQELLGDYAAQTPASTLMVKDVDAIPNDVARLKAIRCAVVAESDEGRRLAEGLVKQLTGGDLVTARFMRAEYFDFRPEFKLFLATNHRPVIRGTDHAIWRRLRLVPFTVQIPESEQDHELANKLRMEFPGILAWAVQGCLAWQQQGLGAPPEVRAATDGYRAEMDLLGEFLKERCALEPEAETTARDLYDAYLVWCEEVGVDKPISKIDFGRRLGERGPRQRRTKSDRRWVGIRLLSVTEQVTMTESDPDSLFSLSSSSLQGERGIQVTERHPSPDASPDASPAEVPAWVLE